MCGEVPPGHSGGFARQAAIQEDHGERARRRDQPALGIPWLDQQADAVVAGPAIGVPAGGHQLIERDAVHLGAIRPSQ
jgi:hypothetical protein